MLLGRHTATRYFDLESERDHARLSAPHQALEGLYGLVVFDEIQQLPRLLPELRVWADQRPLRRRFLILGSASPDLLRGASETLAGRVEFIEMGVDGLYISHDDPGAPYRFGSPIELVERVVELGRQHGMTDHAIAIVPGKKSYGTVVTDVNRNVAAVPGMETALWYFTTLPSEENTTNGNTIGLKRSPAWWHNWPRLDGRFNYAKLGEECSYTPPPSIGMGWGEPTPESLSDGGINCDGMMPWGGGAMPAEHVSNVIGWWGWSPETFDWEAVQNRIADIVYGPDLVDTAREFHNKLNEMREYFVAIHEVCQLVSVDDRDDALSVITEADALLQQIKKDAYRESLLSQEVLDMCYLKPAETQLKVARLLAQMSFPEYWWDEYQKRIDRALDIGKIELAREWTQAARERLDKELASIGESLKEFEIGEKYVANWESRFVSAEIPKVDVAPELIGDLSDPVWQQATLITDFRSAVGGEKDPTELRLLYTDDALYLGFLCHESCVPEMRLNHKGRDSAVWENDAAEIFLNPTALNTPCYQFISNAKGEKFDAMTTGDDPNGPDHWNGEWDVKTCIRQDYWVAEFKIPFKTLGVNESPQGQMWLANFARDDYANPAFSIRLPHLVDINAWSPTDPLKQPDKFNPIWFE